MNISQNFFKILTELQHSLYVTDSLSPWLYFSPPANDLDMFRRQQIVGLLPDFLWVSAVADMLFTTSS